MNRFLKYINIAIGLALATALGAGYWAFYRPLPKTSGSLAAPLDAAAVIARDGLGVPHITAANEEDLLFLQGFVTAQDRMLQMDFARRRTAGELAEVLGPELLDSDREVRSLRFREIAESHSRSLSEANRKAFAAYARGVNFYLETHRGRLPAEFRVLEYDPRPWSAADSVLIALRLDQLLSESWRTDLLKSSLASSGDARRVRELFPTRGGLEGLPGSNVFAISGERTATGKPLLASDPHLPVTAPSFWHQVRLKSPEFDAAGMSIPGLPGVVQGHNEHIAWGAANLPFDVQDLYAERLDPQTGRYVHDGQLRQARQEQAVIHIKGQAAETLGRWVTHHGPIVVSEGNRLQVALRWTAAEAGGFGFPYLDINRARGWREFRAALAGYPGSPLSFLYADAAGNIGYQAAGRLPIRTYNGSEPADGASGHFEWVGYIPFEELPSVFNPPSGVLISANDDPFPEDYPYRVSGRFAPGYRAQRIRELLAAREKWTAGELLSVQTDIYDPFLHGLARNVVAAHESRGIQGAGLDEPIALLRDWDGRMDKERGAPFIALLLFQHLRRAIAESAAPGAGIAYDDVMSPAVVERLFRERPEGWFEDYGQVLLRSLIDAVAEGRRIQGDSVESWRYGAYNQLRFSGGPLMRVRLIGPRFRIEPVPVSGSPHSIQQVTGQTGPSMRLILDCGNWDDSLSVLPLGQSGQRFSPHFDDQRETYFAGSASRLSYQDVRDGSSLEIAPAR